MEPILTIDNLNSFGGNMLRQGDKSELKYRLRDVGNKNLNISGKSCEITMYGRNYTTVVYETTASVSSDNTVSFTIDKVLPKGTFYLEFTVGDYIFPTDHREFFEITPSGKGIESNIIEIVGKDALIQAVKSQVDTELQPLVTTLESAEQAETQRATAESSRVSAEAQREVDHANRSAELAGKADKVVLNNIEGTDFPSWIRMTGTMDFSDGIITMSPTATGVMAQVYWGLGKLDEGDLIYVFSEAEYQDPAVTNVGITLKLGGVGITTSSSYFIFNGSGKHETSDIFKVDQITDEYRVYVEQNFNKQSLPDVIMDLSKVVIVNLTKMFGVGHEPTKEQMDELVNVAEYNDGEYTLNNKEMLDYLMNDIREKANKKQEDWITPTLLNGWEHRLDLNKLQYRKNEFGRVEFRGAVKSGVLGQSIFKLPSGYFKPTTITFLGLNYDGLNAEINIIAGDVSVSKSSSNVWVSFEQVSFYVD